MASITSLIRHWFVRTQVEFQYSKNIEFFSYPLVKGLLLFHNKKPPQQQAQKRKHLGRRTGTNTTLHQGYSVISNSTQAYNDSSECQLFSKVIEL